MTTDIIGIRLTFFRSLASRRRLGRSLGGVPTDPDVQVFRIRLVKLQVRWD
jgi:hypothetical protein